VAGKARDRERKKHKNKERKMPEQKQEPTGLEMMHAQALKKYKVEVLLKAIESFTIFAADQQQAADLVIKEQQGRPAGRQGPNIEAVKVTEMGALDKKEAAVIDNAQTEQSKTEKRLIEVVGA